jgi:hypothetical protein
MNANGITPAQVLDMIAPLVALLLFLAGLALALWRSWRTRRGAEAAELEALEHTQATVSDLLQFALVGMVTAAERSQGAGTGTLKKSIVVAELLRLLPEKLKAAFDAETLGQWIEAALEKARPLWEAPESEF